MILFIFMQDNWRFFPMIYCYEAAWKKTFRIIHFVHRSISGILNTKVNRWDVA